MKTKQTLTIASPILNDTLPTLFSGTEAINQGYDYYIVIKSFENFEYFKTFLGTQFKITYQTQQHKRVFNGIMAHLTEVTSKSAHQQYRIHLISYLQLLKMTWDYRLFKHTTPANVLRQLHHEHGFSKPIIKSAYASKTLSHMAQYDETGYDFILRLLARFNIFFYTQQGDQNQHIVYTDRHQLSLKKIKSLKHSELGLSDYQLWNMTKDSASSTHPDINIGDRIDEHRIITRIKHFITDQAHWHTSQSHQQALFYYQTVYFKNIDQISIDVPPQKPAGLQQASMRAHNSIHPTWDHRHNNTQPIKREQFTLHDKTVFNFDITNKTNVLLNYQNQKIDQPYIVGAIYSRQNPAPFIYQSTNICYGFLSINQHTIKFEPQQILVCGDQNLKLQADVDIRFSIKHNIQISTENRLSIQSKKTIAITSSHKIKLGDTTNYVLLQPHKITIRGIKVNFNT